MKSIKLNKEALMSEDLEFTNEMGDLIEVAFLLGFYSVILNGRCVKATKTLEPVQRKLNYLINK
tara:strand:- start:298 stop:489 length:192 start_codon:yes stop_codon:yes gene_type:complete